MTINTDIWGDSSQWLVNYAVSSSDYDDTNLLFYDGKNHKIDDYTEFEINSPIDYSICYSGHSAADKMPLADIAAVDYRGEVIARQQSDNAWFMAANNTVSTGYKLTTMLNNALGIASSDSTYITRSNSTRWLPQAQKNGYQGENVNCPICPVVKFPLRGFYGGILVGLYHKTDKSYYNTIWLHNLEANIETYAENYYIAKAFLVLYCYNGGGVNTYYSDFARKNVIAFGAGFTQPLKVGDTDILSYTWACNDSWCNLPIFGDCNIGTTMNNIRGVRVFPYDYTTYGDQRGNDCAAIIYSQTLATYKEIVQTTDQYGYNAYLLRIGADITVENIEKIRKGAAAYGIFFTDYNPDDLKTDQYNNTRWTNSKMYCGILDGKGIGHGNYTQGAANVNNKIYNWSSSQDSPYGDSYNIFVGDNQANKIYIGDTAINAAYIGDIKL